MKKSLWTVGLAALLLVSPSAFAAGDVSLTSEQLQWLNDISISVADADNPSDVVVGKTVRIYANVINNSDQDQKGVVRFYNEKTGQYIGTDQPFSAVAKGTDTVFIDVDVTAMGNNTIAIRAIPNSAEGDNPDNNKTTDLIYVDQDADSDGTGNNADADDDGDGVADTGDAFPLNAAETADTDSDGTGNNADADDDGDGVSDIADLFPLDSGDSADRDGDGVGDNADPFPNNSAESADTDNDGVGDNADTNDQNHGPVPQINVSASGAGGGGEGSSGDATGGSANSSANGAGSGSGGNTGSGATGGSTGASRSAAGAAGGSSGGAATGGSSGGSLSRELADRQTAEAAAEKSGSGGGSGAGGSTGANSTKKTDADNVTVKTGEKITFNALESHDPDGTITRVEWDFGDGVIRSDSIVDFAFKKAGLYPIKLRVTDDKGETRESVMTVRAVSRRWLWWAPLGALAILIVWKCFGKKKKKKKS